MARLPRPTPKGLAEADATFDPEEQKAALKKMADSFMDEAWNLPISFRTTLFAFNKSITGLDGGSYDQLRLDQVQKGGSSRFCRIDARRLAPYAATGKPLSRPGRGLAVRAPPGWALHPRPAPPVRPHPGHRLGRRLPHGARHPG